MAVHILQEFADYDCHECDDLLKKERGCNGNGIPFCFDNDIYTTCPLKLITKESVLYIGAYALYKKNLLPNGLAWLDETEKYLTAMRVVEKEYKLIEAKKCQNQS